MGRLRQGTLAAAGLIFVIAWALAAVVLITVTLIAAQQIDDRVDIITGEVQPINVDLDAVEISAETARTAAKIREAAAPLSGQVDRINASGIKETAAKLVPVVQDINAKVKEINPKAESINSTVETINANAASINASVDSIDANLRGVLGETRTIDAGLNRASRDIGVIVNRVEGIKGDTATIIGLVPEINENAAAIRSSPLVIEGGIEDLLGLGGTAPVSAPVSDLTGGGGESPLPGGGDQLLGGVLGGSSGESAPSDESATESAPSGESESTEGSSSADNLIGGLLGG